LSEPTTSDQTETTIKRLNQIRIIAILDLLLLIPLLMDVVHIIDSEQMVSIIGPIHGIGFLLLIFLCVRGAGEGRWGWWFPAIVVVTLGPVGSLYGEHRIRTQIERG